MSASQSALPCLLGKAAAIIIFYLILSCSPLSSILSPDMINMYLFICLSHGMRKLAFHGAETFVFVVHWYKPGAQNGA